MTSPDLDAPALSRHSRLLYESFLTLTGKPLLDDPPPQDRLTRLLFQAPFGLVSHNTESDPVFNYGNQTALALFELDWDSFTRLPSRHSAEPANRTERARLLDRVTQNGYIDDYTGVRIAASGRRFRLENATVWNLIDRDGEYRGQAAVFSRWTFLS